MKYQRISLQSKLMTSIIFIVLIAIFATGSYGYLEARDLYTQKIQKSEENDINNMAQSIEDQISLIKQDANFIANFYAMQKLLNWQSVGVVEKIARWDKVTKDTFASLINLKNFYYKLRVLDLDGKERINVYFDQKTQQSLIQSDNKMQDRSKENYFQAATKLRIGEIHISQMELNSEFGKIIYPYVPIVHFSATIYDKNEQARGVAVINAYAKNFLSSLSTPSDDGIYKKRYMVDSQGYYLAHEDRQKLWGKQLKHGERLDKDNPKLYAYIMQHDHGRYLSKGQLYSFVKVYPNQKDHKEFWVIISEVKKKEVFAPLNSFKMIFFLILTATLLLLFYVIRTIISNLLDPLSQVTQQMILLAKGEVKLTHIAYDANDEINDLINSSQKLVENIESTITQANNVLFGDFTQRLTPNSSKDMLALSINGMTNRLDETSKIAQKLAKGDINTYISVNSEKDTLAHALNALIDYSEQITKIAESISVGNYNVSFKPVSQEDRLGIAIDTMTQTLQQVLNQAYAIANGDYTQSITPKSDEDKLGYALQKMTQTLNDNHLHNQEDNWLKDGLNQLANTLSGVEDVKHLGDETITNIVKHIHGTSGVVYLYDHAKEELYLKSSYAFIDRDGLATHFKKGEGIIGQVALEEQPILLKNIQKRDYTVESGIVNQAPLNTYTFPIIYEGSLMGVAEVASFEYFSPKDKEFMNKSAKVSSAYFFNVTQNMQIKELLEDSQRAYEELQVKSEELQQSNVQMEEQQQQLEQQAQDLKQKNTMLENTKKELDTRAQELEQSSQYKSEFLANMSHELRTPLNSIILLSKMLSEVKDSNLNQEDSKKARVIHQAGQDLLLLINDILDLSKIESGKMELSYDDLATSEILSQAHDLFSPIANQKGVKLILEDHYKNVIKIDRIKLMQIIKNLLSNAFKFTQSGHVRLEISHDSNHSLPLIIRVHDTGIGIANDKKDLIFDAFKQVDGSISRNYGGTGLGLSISKKFTQLMGGDIHVDSQEGEGSCFAIHLPLIQGDMQTPHPIEHPHTPQANEEFSQSFINEAIDASYKEPSPSSSGESLFNDKVILITDDDSRNIFSLSALLQHAGAQTLHALNGQEALDVLAKKKVDLVLMDIMMPTMDGYTAIEEIRKNDAFAQLPIIAVTAKAMKEDKAKCIDAGANDYIAKPIEQDALLMMVKAWLSRS